MQIGDGAATAAAVADGHLEAAKAFLLARVVVLRPRKPGRPAGLCERLDQRVPIPAALDVERAFGTPIGAGAAFPALQPAEIGQVMGIRPAVKALCREAIVVAPVAAHVGHRVGGRRSTDDLAARALDPAAAHAGLGLAEVHPVVRATLQDAPPGERNMEPRIAIPPAGLQDQDVHARVLRKTGREGAPGRPRTDDDVVVAVGSRHRSRLRVTRASQPPKAFSGAAGRRQNGRSGEGGVGASVRHARLTTRSSREYPRRAGDRPGRRARGRRS